MSEASSFISAIFGDGVPGIIITGQIDPKRRDTTRAITKYRFWHWPEQEDDLVDWIDANEDDDLYFSPMLYNRPQRVKDAVIYTPVLWADCDTADPSTFGLTPSIVVETSPNRYHAYWCLKETVSPVWAEQMSKRITYSKRAEGSDFGWSLGKLLRIPGGLNTKPEYINAKNPKGFRVKMTVNGNIYMPDEITDVFGNVDTPILLGLDVPMPKHSDLPKRVTLLGQLKSDPMLDRALNVPPKGKSWSETLWWLECQLFRIGLSAEEVFVLCNGSACDKYQRDGRPEADLWKEVLKAQVEVFSESTHYGPDPDSPPPIITSQRPVLLNDDERRKVPRTFIDDYIEWAATRTNGDIGYHEFGAMCCLSTVLSDFGHAVPAFGPLRLNLWFMLLGVTTRTYKTTAKKLMLEILGKIQTDQYQYDLGSDTTPEGLMMELAEHPNRSVVFHRDEANAMIQDAKGGKSYMSGFGEALTELYDGFVRGRIRATAKNRKVESVETAFNLFLLGVPEKLSAVLTREDFASGFLARFMYVIGKPEPFELQNSALQQMSNAAQEHDDVMRTNLRNRVLAMRSFWSKITEPGDTVGIRCDDESWDRFNKASADLDKLAHDSDVAEVMEPCANRMNKMILKLACLLAMADKQTMVTLPYMLAAIQFCEKWYQNLDTVVRMVGLTEFGARVEQFVTYVHGSEGKTYTEIRRHFKNTSPRQWSEILLAAQELEMVEVVSVGARRYIKAVNKDVVR